MKRKRLRFAEEGGAVARTTLFPTVKDIGIGYPSTGPSSGRSVKMTDEMLLGPVWWSRLQVALEARTTPEAIMKKARELIVATEALIIEKTGYPIDGAFTHALDGGETAPGTHRELLDKGRPAFSEAYNEKFWGTPMGDRTIKDVNELLPEDERGINFGKPTKKDRPGVV